MAGKVDIRLPLKLEYGEFSASAGAYNSYQNPDRYTVNPIKMSNGYIDINREFVLTPSYSLMADISAAIGTRTYERAHYIVDWFTDLATNTKRSGYLIFSRDATKRYFSILRDDGFWEMQVSEFGDIYGPPNTAFVKSAQLPATSNQGGLDPSQYIYPLIAGGDKLYTLVRKNGIWGKALIKVAKVDYLPDGSATLSYHDVIKPVDCLFFQNRAWYICEGPRLGMIYEGPGIIATVSGKADDCSVFQATPSGVVQSAIDYQIFLDGGEIMLNLVSCGHTILVCTNLNLRVIKSGDKETTTITNASIVSYKLLAAVCTGVAGAQFYGLMFIPTTNGLIHRLVSTIEDVTSEPTESLVFRVRDDARQVKKLIQDPDTHLLFALLEDNTIVSFSSPASPEQSGGLIAPSTSYMVSEAHDVIDVIERGHIILQQNGGNKYYLFRKEAESLPPLTLNTFNYIKTSGAWRLEITEIDLVANILAFAPRLDADGLDKLRHVLGVGVIWDNQFFTLQRNAIGKYTSNVPLNSVTGIENALNAMVDVIPEVESMSLFDGGNPTYSYEFGFFDASGNPTRFVVEGDSTPLYFTDIDKSQVMPAYDFYAGSVLSRLAASIEWNVRSIARNFDTFKMTTSLALKDYIDVHPSNGYVNYKHFDVYLCTRSSAEHTGVMQITCTPKAVRSKGSHKQVKISVIQ